MAFTLPDLPYPKDALQPHMSAETFDYHWGKHHKAYVDKTNGFLTEKGLEGSSLLQVIQKATETGDKPLFNNSAQIWNHSFFWQCLAPQGSTSPSGQLKERIDSDFGGQEALLEKLAASSANHFGSGWGWLILNNGFRWTFIGQADVPVATSLAATFAFFLVCLGGVWWIFRTGYRLKQ